MEQDITKKEEADKNNEVVKRGKAAIDAHNEIYKKGKPEEVKNKEEEKDAGKWHSEG